MNARWPLRMRVCSLWCAVFGTWFAAGLALSAEPEAVDRSSESYLAANGFLNRGMYDLAVREYRRFLEEQPTHVKVPVARYGLGVCLFRTEKFDEAAAELAALQTVGDFEFAAETGVLLGQCHLVKGRYAEAATAFAKVLSDFPRHELADDAAAGRVEALYLAGQHAETLTQGRDFVSRFSESPLKERVQFFWGLSAYTSGDLATATARFGELAGRSADGPYTDQATLLLGQCHQRNRSWNEAAQAYRAVMGRKDARGSADAMLGLAQVLRVQGKPEEAGAILDQLLSKFPTGPLVAVGRLQRGLVWFDLGKFDQAVDALRKVGTDDETLNDDVAFWTAKCELRLQKPAEAAARLRAAREKYTDSELRPEMTYDLAVALVRLNELDAAIAALEEFRRTLPSHELSAEVLHLQAVAVHQKQDFDASRKLGREFLEKYSAHPQAGAVLFLLAENDFLSARYAEAAEGYQRFLTQKPDSAERLKAKYRLGIAMYHQQQYDDAQRLLTEVVAEKGATLGFEAAALALGDIRFQRGEWKQAEEQFSVYLGGGLDQPLADDALLKLGLCAQRQERLPEALRSYDRLLEKFPDSQHRLQAKFERGQVLLGLGKSEEAGKAFEQVLAEDHDGKFTSLVENHLGTVALGRKDYGEAARRFERAMGMGGASAMTADVTFDRARALLADQRYAEAELVFRDFLGKAPTDTKAKEARAHLAISVARQDRFADALALMEEIDANSDRLDPSLARSLRYEQAWCLRKIDRAEAAGAVYRSLLDQGEGSAADAHAILELAEIEAEAKRHAEAVSLLRRLKQLIASRGEQIPATIREHGLYRLGVSEFQTEQFAEASASLEELLRAFPETTVGASASFLCGESLFRLGRHEAAAAHLSRVVEKFPSDPACAPALLRLGEVNASLQRWANSERAYADYLARFADGEQWFQAQFGVAWAQENQGRTDEAITAYKRVVERHQGPTAARAQFQIGECFFAKQQYQEAVGELLKVDILYAYPEWSAAALYEAGRCFLKLAKPAEAKAQFTTVVEKHGSTQWAAMASRELSAMSAGERGPVGAAAGSRGQ